MTANRQERTLQVADEIAALLRTGGIESVVIGAAAVAAWGYPRFTEDFDLATDTDPFLKLKPIGDELRKRGFDVEFNAPDAEDPLGGLLRVSGNDFDTIDVVNFYNPFGGGSTLGTEAVRSGALVLEGTNLKVVALPHLIALKLYGGGAEALRDVTELVERRPDLDLALTRDLCRRHGLLDKLERVLSELGRS